MERFTNRLVWILEKLVTMMIVTAVILIGMQVFMRYVVSSPLSWTEQISRYLFIWMIMLGIPIMFHRKIYMAFDLIFDSLDDRKQRLMGIIIKVAICFFALFYFRYSLSLCINTYGRMTAGVKLPLYMVYGAQPASASCIFIVTLNQLLIEIKNRGNSDGHDHPAEGEII